MKCTCGKIALRRGGWRRGCPDAARHQRDAERPPTRRLTTYERHQLAADHGQDTWAERRGER